MKHTLIRLAICGLFCLCFTASAAESATGSLSETEITALVDGDLKRASKRIAKELKQHPDAAELHKIAGDIFAVRAQSASIFSAPGLARKILKSYKQAVALAPKETRYRMALMQFYLFAPGIVGGSKKLGKQQAKEIKKLDPASGVVADSFVLLNAKDEAGLAALFKALAPELKNHPKVIMAHANYLRSTEQFSEAYALIEDLTQLDSDTLPKDQVHLPYQALLQAGFLATKSEPHYAKGIDAFQRYIEQAPETYKLTSKKWARLFLGKLYALAGETELAKTTLLGVRESATDVSLIDQIENALKEI